MDEKLKVTNVTAGSIRCSMDKGCQQLEVANAQDDRKDKMNPI